MIRLFLLRQISGLTNEQLNKIPAGYNNNIIWNLGHLICSQQSICYIRAGRSITVGDNFFSPFLTNTKPAGFINAQQIDEIKALFIRTIDELATDLENKLFENYKASPNILRLYKIELTTIEDALDFLLYHEGFHSGYIIALKHLVG